MTRSRATLMLVLTAAAFSACTGRDGNRIRVESDDVIPGCSRFLSCVHPWVGMGICAHALFTAERWNLKEMSFYLGTVTRDDWLQVLSGCQHSHCLAQEATSCDEVLRCMNRGLLVRDCTPPEGYFGGRYCRDSNTLSVCGDLDEDGTTTEISVECDLFGMECIEMDRGQDLLAACAYRDPDPPQGLGTKVKVSCDGTVAKLQRYGAVMYWDCGFMKAACQPGIYDGWDQHEFCKSSGPACQLETMDWHCDGNLTVQWCNGNEIGFDCATVDQICRRIRVLLADMVTCTYDTACNPFNFEETCQDGVVKYCGPDGVTTISCGQYGFDGCTQNKYSFFVTCL